MVKDALRWRFVAFCFYANLAGRRYPNLKCSVSGYCLQDCSANGINRSNYGLGYGRIVAHFYFALYYSPNRLGRREIFCFEVDRIRQCHARCVCTIAPGEVPAVDSIFECCRYPIFPGLFFQIPTLNYPCIAD